MKKMKLILTGMVVVAALFAGSVNAQSVKGVNYVNGGVGLGTFGLSGKGGLPIVLSAEHGFSDQITGGVYVGFIKRNFENTWKWSYTVVGVRASYHVNELLKIENEKTDLYGGASLYYRGYKLKYKGQTGGDMYDPAYKASGGTVGLGLYIGGRYMFAENVGAFAELGYGVSPLQLGVTLKF